MVWTCTHRSGFDAVRKEVNFRTLTETRRFYQHFREVWSCWFFFCDLETETLQMMTLCLLPNLTGIKHLGAPKAGAQYDPLDLIRFIEKNFTPLNSMLELAGMSELDIYHRTRDVLLYFKLPFDVERF